MSLTEIEEGFLNVVKSATPYNSNEEIKLYRVGGYVRDKYLGIPSKDVDYVVTNVTFDELCRVLRNSYGKVIDTEVGDSMNVIKVHIEGYELFDFAIPRKDIYGNSGNHTDLVTIGDPSMKIEDDLSRRDITINAIAQDVETNEIIDPFGGIKDIKNVIIRAVGNPKDRFTEDALRIMRIIQFAVRFDFDIEEETYNSIKDNVHLLKNITGERIDGELVKAFEKNKSNSNCVLVKLLIDLKIGEFLFNDFRPFYSSIIKGNKTIINYCLLFWFSGDYSRLKLSSNIIEHIELTRKYFELVLENSNIEKYIEIVYKKDHLKCELINTIKSIYMLSESWFVEILEKHPINPKDINIDTQWLMQQGIIGKNITNIHKKLLKLIWENKLINEENSLKEYIIKEILSSNGDY